MLTRPKLITITGQPGAGKTTACKNIAAELGWEYFNTGIVMRKLGESRGLTVTEINALAETDKSIDEEIDSVYKKLNESDKPYLIDARLGWYFMPKSFKVMFHVPVEIGAARVLQSDSKRTGEEYRDIASAVASMKARRESERQKHRNSYGIQNDGDHAHFDLILDTSYSSPDRNVSFVRSAYWLWNKGIKLPRVWMSPKSLYPTRGVDFLIPATVETIRKNIDVSGYDTLHPIKATMVQDQLYILDGHHRVAAAIKATIDFLPVELVTGEDLSLTLSDISSWEKLNDFSFAAPAVAINHR